MAALSCSGVVAHIGQTNMNTRLIVLNSGGRLNTKNLRYVAYTWSALDDDDTSRSHRDTHLRLQALQQGLRRLNYDQVRRIFPLCTVGSVL